jgi:hypothetical protein
MNDLEKGIKKKNDFYCLLRRLLVCNLYLLILSMHGYTQAALVVEKRIGNVVYELNTEDYTLRNKSNRITSAELNYAHNVHLENSEQVHKARLENFKPLFSKERANELNVRIGLYCIADSTGQVLEVSLFFRNRETFEMFTPSEIQAIEDTAKRYHFNVLRWYNGREGENYFSFSFLLIPICFISETQDKVII